MKKPTMLYGMFLDIATKEEKQTVDRLLEESHKGSAEVYMLKRIRDHWIVMINREEKAKYTPYYDRVCQKPIKINYWKDNVKRVDF